MIEGPNLPIIFKRWASDYLSASFSSSRSFLVLFFSHLESLVENLSVRPSIRSDSWVEYTYLARLTPHIDVAKPHSPQAFVWLFSPWSLLASISIGVAIDLNLLHLEIRVRGSSVVGIVAVMNFVYNFHAFLCFCFFKNNAHRYSYGHNSSDFHSPCPSLSPSSTDAATKVYFHRRALTGSLMSHCSTSSGLIMTTRKFSRATGSWRSVTDCPSLCSSSGCTFATGLPGGGFFHVPGIQDDQRDDQGWIQWLQCRNWCSPLIFGLQLPNCAVSSLPQLQSPCFTFLILAPTSLFTVLTPLLCSPSPSISGATTNASPFILHWVPLSLIQYTASIGPPPPLPWVCFSFVAWPSLLPNSSPTFSMRTSVVKVGRSDS